jgi:hypothetical protein
MTFTILTIVLFILFAVYAICEGFDDAWEADYDKHIDHGEQLAWRMFFGSIFLVAYSFAVERFAAWWLFIPASTAMLAWWAMIFRLTMNLSRKRPKRDWRYVSPSNWYDRLWISMTWDRRMVGTSHWDELYHTDLSSMPKPVQAAIHCAGTIAYIFEACILAASVVGLIAAIR